MYLGAIKSCWPHAADTASQHFIARSLTATEISTLCYSQPRVGWCVTSPIVSLICSDILLIRCSNRLSLASLLGHRSCHPDYPFTYPDGFKVCGVSTLPHKTVYHITIRALNVRVHTKGVLLDGPTIRSLETIAHKLFGHSYPLNS